MYSQKASTNNNDNGHLASPNLKCIALSTYKSNTYIYLDVKSSNTQTANTCTRARTPTRTPHPHAHTHIRTQTHTLTHTGTAGQGDWRESCGKDSVYWSVKSLALDISLTFSSCLSLCFGKHPTGYKLICLTISQLHAELCQHFAIRWHQFNDSWH